jgi:hypothetical protein
MFTSKQRPRNVASNETSTSGNNDFHNEFTDLMLTSWFGKEQVRLSCDSKQTSLPNL